MTDKEEQTEMVEALAIVIDLSKCSLWDEDVICELIGRAKLFVESIR